MAVGTAQQLAAGGNSEESTLSVAGGATAEKQAASQQNIELHAGLPQEQHVGSAVCFGSSQQQVDKVCVIGACLQHVESSRHISLHLTHM
jgi:hypothetical protein